MTAIGPKECPNESMDNLSHGRVIGIDVSRDWLDIHCLPDGYRARMPNAPAGHAAVADLARDLVCFESTGGQEWQLWAVLEAEGIAARQVPRLKLRRLRKAVAQAPKRTGLMPSSSLASSPSGPKQAAVFQRKSYAFSEL